MRRVIYWPGLGKSHYHHQLGLVAQAMSLNPAYRRYPTAVLPMWIEPALRHKQIGFFFDEFNAPLGYLTWAYLAPDVVKRWKEDPSVQLHESEWNEGESLWVLDFVVTSGWCGAVVRYACRNLFPGQSVASSLRRMTSGQVKKASQWRRREKN